MEELANRKENKEYAQSAALTALIWLALAAALFFIPFTTVPPREKEFTEIQLRLAPERAVFLPQAESAESAPASQAAPVPAETIPAEAFSPPAAAEIRKPAPPEPAAPAAARSAPPVPAKKEPVKTEPVKTETAAAASVPQTLAPDLSTLDFGAASPAAKPSPKAAEWPDEDQFTVQTSKTASGGSQSAASSSAKSPPVSAPITQFEGSAGAVSRQSDSPAVTSSSAARREAGSASAATGESLKRIVSETFSNSGGAPGISYETTVQMVADNTSGVSIQMRDGTSRRLLDPAKPHINLSPPAEQLIDASKRVMISFRVLASGSVPLAEITLSPAALLPVEVQREIREQIARWRFESAPGDGQAIFQYSIKKE